MNNYFEILKKYPNFVLSTVDEKNKPHVRIVQFLFEINNELYFCTNSEKNMSKQMKKNNNISIISYSSDFSEILRLNGTVRFLDDIALKKRALDENPGIKEIYKDESNPIFEICAVNNLETE